MASPMPYLVDTVLMMASSVIFCSAAVIRVCRSLSVLSHNAVVGSDVPSSYSTIDLIHRYGLPVGAVVFSDDHPVVGAVVSFVCQQYCGVTLEMPTPVSPFSPSVPSSTILTGDDHDADVSDAVASLLIAAADTTQHGFPSVAGMVFVHPLGFADSAPDANVYVTAVDGFAGVDAERL